MQLPVVLVVRPTLQRRPLRQVERFRVPGHAASRHFQVPSCGLRKPHAPAGAFHSDFEAHSSACKVVQKSALLPAKVALVLSLLIVDHFRRGQKLLL